MPLHTRIFIGLFIGLLAGLVTHTFFPNNESISFTATYFISPVGQIFMRLIFMMVLPLMVSALILAVNQLGIHQRVSSVSFKGFTFAILMAICASAISLLTVNIAEPGKRISETHREEILAALEVEPSFHEVQKTKQNIVQKILNIIPKNPVKAFAQSFDADPDAGGIIPVMVFSLLFGFGMVKSPREKIAPLVDFFEALYTLSTRFLSMVMNLAPYAVAALIFTNVNKFGIQLILLLSNYILVVLAGLLTQMFVVYPIVLKLGAKRSPLEFFRSIKNVIMTAFSTSSSSATLPVAIDTASNKLNLDRSVSQFIVTLGASANQNGSALYEGITVLFLAQLFGIDLNFTKQLTVLVMCIVASLGTAGVPGGTIPFIISILITLGIPADGIILILGVERILDMSRTVINVVGDVVLACWVDRSEKRAQAKANS